MMDYFCPSCGSTIIQGENDGCNGPRVYTCEICGRCQYHTFPKTFPKRLRVKEVEFARLYLNSEYTEYHKEEARAAMQFFLYNSGYHQINKSKETKGVN